SKERSFSLESLPELLTTDKSICSYCDCNLNRTSPPLFKFPTEVDQTSSKARVEVDRSSMAAHLWRSIRDIYCRHSWLGEGPALDLLLATDLSRDFSTHVQWRLNSLKPDVPTAYLFTKTSWAGKTKHLRYAFFKRHILTIRTHLDLIRRSKWPEDGLHSRWGQNRQLIWIVVEDGERLSNDVAQELSSSSDLAYVYFAYGPTHHFGNAQQNAAYSLIHRLSDRSMGGFLAHGPIISIDDDSNFLPELLVMIWKTKRIGVWPMGNLGPHGWEGPVYDETHRLVKWEAGAVKDRKFPIDNGAFSFMSDLLGSVIKGPRYWPTDISGGENEFISKIVKSKEDIEPLCYNCHVAWHNEPLPPACTDLQICP
ncbi:nucleotide-diphospho-sugar transferase, partial [Phakopsora pachyrhizi]